MKKVILVSFILLTFSSPVIAQNAQLDAEQTGNFIQEQTQQMTKYGVAQESAEKMLQSMVQNRYRKQSMLQASVAVMEAAREGLPTEPIISKAMEGMAKKVSEAQVVAAMNTVKERHSYVHKVAASLPNNKTNKELSRAIADSLAAGMKKNDMDEIANQLQTRTRQQTQNNAEELCLQTMQTVRTMAQMGINSSDVSNALQNALQNNFTATEMHQMRNRMYNQSDIDSPIQAAHQYAGEIGKGLGNNFGAAGDGTGSQNGDGNNGGSGNGSSNGSDNGASGDSGGNSSGGSGTGGSGSSGESGSSGGSGNSDSSGSSGDTGSGTGGSSGSSSGAGAGGSSSGSGGESGGGSNGGGGNSGAGGSK